MHSEEPWEIFRSVRKATWWLTIKSKYGCRVADLTIPNKEINEANALLIKNAPNMLAALRKIEHYARSKPDAMTLDDIARTAHMEIRKTEGLLRDDGPKQSWGPR